MKRPWYMPLVIVCMAVGGAYSVPDFAASTASADERSEAEARAHLDRADEEANGIDDYLQELAASDPETARMVRQARAKAKQDTDRSRFPAMVEGVARQAAGVLGGGPLVDVLAGTGTTVAVGAAAYLFGGRRRPEDEEADTPQPKRRRGAATRFPDEGSYSGREHATQGRHHAASESALMSDAEIDIPRPHSQRNRTVVTP